MSTTEDPLISAIKRNDQFAAELILKGDKSPNYTNSNDWTPLKYALYEGREWAVSLLLGSGADPNFFGKKGDTALANAILYDNEWAAKLLLENGADPNLAGEGAWTPLEYAIRFENIKAVELLLDNGADPNMYLGDGDTPLTHVLRFEDGFAADLLLAKGANPNLVGSEKEIALHIAIFRDNYSAAKLIIEKGADVNLLDEKERTPLASAIFGNKVWAVELLLSKGVEPNLRLEDGKMALEEAIILGKKRIAKLLLGYGANLCSYGENGWTPLILAINKGQRWAVQLLLEHGSNPDAYDKQHKSPLMYAIENDKGWAAKLLLENEADPNLVDKDGRTPLTYAIELNREWAIRLFLENEQSPPISRSVIQYTTGDHFQRWKKVWEEVSYDMGGMEERYWANLLQLKLNGQMICDEVWKLDSEFGKLEIIQQLYDSFNRFLEVTNSQNKHLFKPVRSLDDFNPETAGEHKLFLFSSALKTSTGAYYTVGVGCFKDFIVFCDREPEANKGWKRKKPGTMIFQIKEKSLSKNLINQIKKLKSNEDWENLIKNDALTQIEELSLTTQWSESHCLASLKGALYGLLLLQAKEQGVSPKLAYAFYKQWAFWDRQDMLKKYFSLEHVYNVLCWVLGDDAANIVKSKLVRTRCARDFLYVLTELSKKVNLIDGALLYASIKEAFQKRLISTHRNRENKAYEDINRVLSSIPVMIGDLQYYYERECKLGMLDELEWRETRPELFAAKIKAFFIKLLERIKPEKTLVKQESMA